MKEQFSEYYGLNSKEKEKLWGEAIFVFDANVLLNLYRYSEKTRKEFLNILEKMEDKIWLPHQFALEYQRNRLEVIEEQSRSYDDVSTKLQNGLENIHREIEKYQHRHPFLKVEKLLKKISVTIKTAKKEVEDTKGKHPNWFEKDSIRDRLDKIFYGKIGSPCKDLCEVERDGANRFSKKIPPGYEDIKKDGPDSLGTRKYGDWIGWYQIMEMASGVKKSIILVTSERKEDWWQKVKGKIVGPRPELIKEISQYGISFHMYSVENFLDYATPIYKVKSETVKEIEEFNKKTTENITSSIESSSAPTSTSGVESGSVNIPIEEAGKQNEN